eukprot:245595_1
MAQFMQVRMCYQYISNDHRPILCEDRYRNLYTTIKSISRRQNTKTKKTKDEILRFVNDVPNVALFYSAKLEGGNRPQWNNLISLNTAIMYIRETRPSDPSLQVLEAFANVDGNHDVSTFGYVQVDLRHADVPIHEQLRVVDDSEFHGQAQNTFKVELVATPSIFSKELFIHDDEQKGPPPLEAVDPMIHSLSTQDIDYILSKMELNAQVKECIKSELNANWIVIGSIWPNINPNKMHQHQSYNQSKSVIITAKWSPDVENGLLVENGMMFANKICALKIGNEIEQMNNELDILGVINDEGVCDDRVPMLYPNTITKYVYKNKVHAIMFAMSMFNMDLCQYGIQLDTSKLPLKYHTKLRLKMEAVFDAAVCCLQIEQKTNIFHRDIKCKNIFIRINQDKVRSLNKDIKQYPITVAVGDFGLSAYSSLRRQESGFDSQYIGSPDFVAPHTTNHHTPKKMASFAVAMMMVEIIDYTKMNVVRDILICSGGEKRENVMKALFGSIDCTLPCSWLPQCIVDLLCRSVNLTLDEFITDKMWYYGQDLELPSRCIAEMHRMKMMDLDPGCLKNNIDSVELLIEFAMQSYESNERLNGASSAVQSVNDELSETVKSLKENDTSKAHQFENKTNELLAHLNTFKKYETASKKKIDNLKKSVTANHKEIEILKSSLKYKQIELENTNANVAQIQTENDKIRVEYDRLAAQMKYLDKVKMDQAKDMVQNTDHSMTEMKLLLQMASRNGRCAYKYK